MLCDFDGLDIPWSQDDQTIECTANDEDAGDPAEWPEWVDIYRWVPTQNDTEWLNNRPALPATGPDPSESFVPSAADWADYHEWCKHVDGLNELRRMEDAQYEARMRLGD
jgi:hypothetical protein